LHNRRQPTKETKERERKCQDEDLEVDHQVEAEEGAVRRVGVVEEAAVAGTSPILLLMYV